MHVVQTVGWYCCIVLPKEDPSPEIGYSLSIKAMLACVNQHDILHDAGAVYIGLQTVPVQCRFQTALAHMINVFLSQKLYI